MAFGESYFWANSYADYYDMAGNVIAGKGFCIDASCALCPPLYPLFLALTRLGGHHYLLIVIPQALLGAGTALCAFFIGRTLFSPFTGILAAGFTSLYPYYLMHDTAMQETGMVTFWTAATAALLLWAGKSERDVCWLYAGLAAAMVALTRASTATIAPVALVWILIWGVHGNASLRLRKAAIFLVGFLLLVGPWLVRTQRVTGAYMLSSQTGRALWIGNNAQTFSAYPSESMDVSEGHAWDALPAADLADIQHESTSESKASKWYAHRALVFIREHPLETLHGAARKVIAGFSWRLNPVRGGAAELAYALTYTPIAVLGTAGMLLAWRNNGVVLIALLFLAFIAASAVFWAHTSHRSYLDIYWIVFAASVIERLTLRSSFRRRIKHADVV
jgi:4-amino-4-deoxy-L-arabinose transferase-like glycosyltransferase